MPANSRWALIRVLKGKALVYSVAIENEGTHHQRLLRPVRPFATAPGPHESVRQSTIRCVHLCIDWVEDILNIPCEL